MLVALWGTNTDRAQSVNGATSLSFPLQFPAKVCPHTPNIKELSPEFVQEANQGPGLSQQ